MPPLGVEEEVIKGKGLNILTPNKLLIIQIKAGKNSYKFKN